MGTNYYIESAPCECCGRGGDEIHVGKASAGWKFLFARIDENGLNSGAAWADFISRSDGRIKDEYGRRISSGELLALIMRKQKDRLPALNCWQKCGCSSACRPSRNAKHETICEGGFRISAAGDFC